MSRTIALTFLIIVTMVVACSSGDEDNIDLAPVLFQASFEINPNPADLHETVTFIMGWEDQDGDFAGGTVLVRMIDEDDQEFTIPFDNLKIYGKTKGSLSFTVEVLEWYEGTYYVSAQDEAGHVSEEEIDQVLYVNPEPGSEE